MTGLELSALQRALAAEQAIVYGYGIVGAHLPADAQNQVTAIWNAHRQRRDVIAGFVQAAGATPVSPKIAYATPFPVTDEASARRLAADLESGGAGAAWDLVTVTTAASAARQLAVTWLTSSAVDEVRVAGGVPAALPGAPDTSAPSSPTARVRSRTA